MVGDLLLLGYVRWLEASELVFGLFEIVFIWLMGTGVHVLLARKGTPDMQLFQIQKTMEMERATLRQAQGSDLPTYTDEESERLEAGYTPR